MQVRGDSQLSYDPYNVEIDIDPYPTYKRLRDEAPLYYNEKFDFWGLSRFADVEAALRDSLAELKQTQGRLQLADRLASMGTLAAGVAPVVTKPNQLLCR